MAQLWDILGKASVLIQLLGLDAFKLVIIAMSLLRLRESRKECWKLEERVRMLRVLLSSPVGCWIMTQQQHMELGDLVTSALRDAQCLVACYNESTLVLRVRRGRSMARQFQDLHNRIDYYCGLILTVNSCLPLPIVQANPPPVIRPEANDGNVAPRTGYFTDAQISSTVAHDTHIITVTEESV